MRRTGCAGRLQLAGFWLALAALVAAALTGCSGKGGTAGPVIRPAGTAASSPRSDVRVALAYVNPDAAADPASASAIGAVKRAITGFGIEATMVPSVHDASPAVTAARLRRLARDGYNPVIVLGHTYTGPLDQVAPGFPRTQFAIVDGPADPAKNVTQLMFDEVQGTFLIGTIAALASKTKQVGFVGAVDVPALETFARGFTQGARAADPAVKVAVGWIALEASGFTDPAAGRKLAQQMIKQGSDVLFTVAYTSNAGVFSAAAAQRSLAIGMETDQYAQAPAGQRGAILTSLIKNTGVPVYAMIESAVDGSMLTGVHTFGVRGGGVSYATSNPLVRPFEARANAYAQKLSSGAIGVQR